MRPTGKSREKRRAVEEKEKELGASQLGLPVRSQTEQIPEDKMMVLSYRCE